MSQASFLPLSLRSPGFPSPRFPLCLAALLALIVTASPAIAQNDAFLGTWAIDLERSDAIMPNGQKINSTYHLSFEGSNMVVKRTFIGAGGQTQAMDWTVVTDGKPHELPGFRKPRETRAKWKKDKLNMSYSMSFDTPRGAFDIDVQEIWKINKKGDLEITYVRRMPQRSETVTEIYTRSAD